ncbi:HipA family kinase [Luteimonas salinilitoris]|uniref:HipA family kinase n=1 Tax=Luteimonas salinilitoris TaxID=3237697 RepID=A0ABV4HMR2_9GAMM
MRTVRTTRYVTPLREGGSLPAVIEADDEGMYVLKFRGAGQGPRALVAELIAGELARALGLPVPEIVKITLDPELARTEGDPEIQALIRASAGLNLGLDYLPGAIAFDPVADRPDSDLASAIVWFDAYVSNVDRTARNPNLMIWHRRLMLIDHGAALYFHHDWDNAEKAAASPFRMIADHVLLPFADSLEAADARMTAALDETLIRRAVDLVPDDWLDETAEAATAQSRRDGYIEHLCRRLQARHVFVEEALRARASV